MKVRTLFAALALIMIASVGTADARKMNDSDKAVVSKVMKYIGGIANIINTHMNDTTDKPKVMLVKLKKYVNANKAALHAAGAKIDTIEKELDADEKAAWKKYVQDQPQMKALMKGLMTFMSKHSNDKALMDQFGAIMKSMDPKNSKK